jgi:hypothetical protein
MTVPSKCQACKAPVSWKRTPAGRFIGVDPDKLSLRLVPIEQATPDEIAAGRRRTIVLDTRKSELEIGIELPSTLDPGRRAIAVSGYEAHWTVCPAARRES